MDHWLAKIFVDLTTPFDRGTIDTAGLASLVRWQAGRGIRGFVIAGAIGECATLSADERLAIAAIVRANAGRYAHLIMSAGSNDTAATLLDVDLACRSGADAILLRTPFYSRPTQAGIIAHITAASARSTLPIILDDDPDRCGVAISAETLGELVALPNIVGLLDRRGDIGRCERVSRALPGRYALLGGQIGTFTCFRLSGGCGAVSAEAALFPSLCSWLIASLRQDDYPTAQMLQRRAYQVLELLGPQPSAARMKAALALLRPGSIALECRVDPDPIDARWSDEMKQALAGLPRDGATIRQNTPCPTFGLDHPLEQLVARVAAKQAQI